MNDRCPICSDLYSEVNIEVEYHVDYSPAITTHACRGCNYAEYLIRHPEVISEYPMERKKILVREWTYKNKLLIE